MLTNLRSHMIKQMTENPCGNGSNPLLDTIKCNFKLIDNILASLVLKCPTSKKRQNQD